MDIRPQKSCELDSSWTIEGIWTRTYAWTNQVLKVMGSKVKVKKHLSVETYWSTVCRRLLSTVMRPRWSF